MPQCLVELGTTVGAGSASKLSLPSSCCSCFRSSGFEPASLSSNVSSDNDLSAYYRYSARLGVGVRDHLRDEMGYTPRDHAEHVLYERAEEIEEAQGREAAARYYKISTSKSPMLSETVSLWLEDIKGRVAEQTRGHHRAALWMFQKATPQVLFTSDVDRAQLRLAEAEGINNLHAYSVEHFRFNGLRHCADGSLQVVPAQAPTVQ
jgi:hypothetical protein